MGLSFDSRTAHSQKTKSLADASEPEKSSNCLHKAEAHVLLCPIVLLSCFIVVVCMWHDLADFYSECCKQQSALLPGSKSRVRTHHLLVVGLRLQKFFCSDRPKLRAEFPVGAFRPKLLSPSVPRRCGFPSCIEIQTKVVV